MNEQTIYQGDRATVTRRRLVVGAKTYALENITLATAQKSSNRASGWMMVALGVGLLVLLLATGNDQGLCLAVVAGMVLVGIAVALAGGDLWWVYVETAQGKRRKVLSAPEAEALALVEAINQAAGAPYSQT